MQLNIHPLKTTDYEEILCKWWKDWRWTPPPQDFLPENGTGGLMVYDGDIPVVAGYLYNTNSNVVWIDFIVSNFQYKDKKNRKLAIKLLILALEERTKQLGKYICYALIKNKSLVSTYKELGYTQGDAYSTELIKRI